MIHITIISFILHIIITSIEANWQSTLIHYFYVTVCPDEYRRHHHHLTPHHQHNHGQSEPRNNKRCLDPESSFQCRDFHRRSLLAGALQHHHHDDDEEEDMTIMMMNEVARRNAQVKTIAEERHSFSPCF